MGVIDIEIVVYSDRCTGSGGCQRSAPAVFGSDADGMVTLLKPNPPKTMLSELLEAHGVCPVAAIEVLDDRWERLA